MKVHDLYYDYDQLPAGPVMMLLESNIFFWLVVVVTAAVGVWVAAKAWQLHSLPKKHSKGQAQSKLVFWMCLLGLAWKPLWIAAVIMILVDWDALASWVRINVLGHSNVPQVSTQTVEIEQ